MTCLEILGGNVQTLKQIVDEVVAAPRQKLNSDPHWVVRRLRDAFTLAIKENCDELPHPKLISSHLSLSFALLSDNTAPLEPPNQDPNSPEFKDWLLTSAINALVLDGPQRVRFRGKFLENAEIYLNN